MRLVATLGPLLAAVILLQLSSGGVGPLDALVGRAQGFTADQIGLMGSAQFAGFLAGCWWAPRLLGTVGHSRAFAAFTALGTMGLIGHILVADPYAWAALRLGSGLCIAGCYTVIEAWLHARVANETRARASGVYRSADLGASLMAQLMVGILAPLEIQVAYAALALVCCAALLPLALTTSPAPVVGEAPRLRPRLAASRSPLAVAGVAVAGLSGGSFRMVGPVYAAETGQTPSEVGLFLAAFVAGGAAAQLPLGWIADRVPRRHVLAGLGLASAAACGAVAWSAGAGVGAAWTAAAAFGFASFPIYSVAAAHAHDFAQGDERVELSAALIFWFAVGAILAPLGAARLIALAGPAAMFALIGAGCLALAAYAVLRGRARPAEARTAYVYTPRTTMVQGRLLAEQREGRGTEAPADRPPAAPPE